MKPPGSTCGWPCPPLLLHIPAETACFPKCPYAGSDASPSLPSGHHIGSTGSSPAAPSHHFHYLSNLLVVLLASLVCSCASGIPCPCPVHSPLFLSVYLQLVFTFLSIIKSKYSYILALLLLSNYFLYYFALLIINN